MKVPITIGSKSFLIQPYKTYQEKDILLLSSFDIDDLDRVLDILNFKADGLTDDEKRLILYKHREISIGDDINIRFKCKACGQGNESILTASNFIIDSVLNDTDIKKINKEVTDENLHEFVDIDVDDLDILDFELLKNRVKDNQIKINFVKSAYCLKCNEEHPFDIGSAKYIIEIMSEDELMSLYKTYSSMIYFGHFTKEDIDNMYPFERTVFVGLLNKIKEDLANDR